jgi:hypothetical protein
MKVYHFNVNCQNLPSDYYAGQNLLFPFPSIWTTYLFGGRWRWVWSAGTGSTLSDTASTLKSFACVGLVATYHYCALPTEVVSLIAQAIDIAFCIKTFKIDKTETKIVHDHVK